MKKQSLKAMTVPYDTGEHCIMVHMTSHYPNFPDHRKNACNWDEFTLLMHNSIVCLLLQKSMNHMIVYRPVICQNHRTVEQNKSTVS